MNVRPVIAGLFLDLHRYMLDLEPIQEHLGHGQSNRLRLRAILQLDVCRGAYIAAAHRPDMKIVSAGDSFCRRDCLSDIG